MQVRVLKLIEALQKMFALATARRATSLRRTLARQRLASTARRLSVEVPRSALAAAPLTLAFAATSCAHSARKERRKQIRRRDSDADIHGLDHEPEDSEVVEWNPKNEPDWKCPYWDDDVVPEDEQLWRDYIAGENLATQANMLKKCVDAVCAKNPYSSKDTLADSTPMIARTIAEFVAHACRSGATSTRTTRAPTSTRITRASDWRARR